MAAPKETPPIGLFGPRAAEPGRYAVVALSQEATVNPGQSVHINLYVTGYGRLDYAKIAVFTPPEIIDEKESKFSGGLNWIIKGPNEAEIKFGQTEENLMAGCSIFNLQGVLYKEKYYLGCMIDMPKRSHADSVVPTTVSEQTLDQRSLFQLTIATSGKVKRGIYKFTFVLTYYNGDHWENSIAESEVRVVGRIERNQVSLAVIGIVLVVVQIGIPSEKVFQTIISPLFNIIQKFFTTL